MDKVLAWYFYPLPHRRSYVRCALETYRKESLLYGVEVIFYTFAVFLGVILLLKDWENNLIILSIVSFAIGYFLMHMVNGLGLNFAMYAVQMGFGFADVFLLYTLIKLKNPLKAFPIGFMAVCGAILVGYFLFKLMDDTRGLIAMGNFILVGFSIYLVYASRASRRNIEETSQELVGLQTIEDKSHIQKIASPEDFLHELCSKRETYKKTLSKREREVILLVLEGLSKEEIGKYLGISTSSVREYIRRATEKLNVSKEELISMYEEWKSNL